MFKVKQETIENNYESCNLNLCVAKKLSMLRKANGLSFKKLAEKMSEQSFCRPNQEKVMPQPRTSQASIVRMCYADTAIDLVSLEALLDIMGYKVEINIKNGDGKDVIL